MDFWIPGMTYVLPHEKVGLVTFVHTMSQSLEVSQRNNFKRLLRLLQPALLISKHIRHYIRPTTNPRNTNSCAIQLILIVDRALVSNTDGPTQRALDVCADEFVGRCFLACVCLS